MPAASDPAVVLPHVFRPLGVRMAAYVVGLLLLVVVLVIWFAFPQDVRDQFTILQRATVIFFGLCAGVAGHALTRSRVEARPDAMTVVNGYRTHRYEWNEVLAVSLRAGSPWATLDLSDGTTVPAMGIQGSDGSRARTQLTQLRTLLDQQTRTERDS